MWRCLIQLVPLTILHHNFPAMWSLKARQLARTRLQRQRRLLQSQPQLPAWRSAPRSRRRLPAGTDPTAVYYGLVGIPLKCICNFVIIGTESGSWRERAGGCSPPRRLRLADGSPPPSAATATADESTASATAAAFSTRAAASAAGNPAAAGMLSVAAAASSRGAATIKAAGGCDAASAAAAAARRASSAAARSFSFARSTCSHNRDR